MLTTPGQLLVDEALPEDMRRGQYDLNKKSTQALLREVAEKHPEQYREVLKKLMLNGHYAGRASGLSVSLKALVPPQEIEQEIIKLKAQVHEIAQSELPDDEKEKKITGLVGAATPHLKDRLFEIAQKEGNPLALQAASGSRGNSTQLMQLVLGDMLVQDHRDRIIGVPILSGYSKGLDPVEYFAGAYGARRGAISAKMSTADAGFYLKRINSAAHRLVVTTEDCGTTNGITSEPGDKDSIGAVLAQPVDGLEAGHILTAKDISRIKEPYRVRSAITCQAPQGICAKCAGVREKGKLPHVGDNVGMPAVQAIGEKLSQGMLSAKHSGGVVGGGGPSKAGFRYVDSLAEVPQEFPGGAALSSKDGRVENIQEAPQGGWNVFVGGVSHYVKPDQNVTVKAGDDVEAGDSLSNGIPNPAELVKYKGIGEARMLMLKALQEGLESTNAKAHRRNAEILSRALVNHVKVTPAEGYAGYLPDDVVPADQLFAVYTPRDNAKKLNVSNAVGQYLERPAMHYTVGTRITPRVAKKLQSAGYNEVEANVDPPPFEPIMIRATESAMRDPNFLTRMSGSYLEKGLTEAVHRGRSASLKDTSYVPGLARGADFGTTLDTTGTY